MFNLIKRLTYSLYYYFETRKNFYPCKLTGEYQVDKLGKTVIEVKNFGNGKHFYSSVEKIFNDKQLLEKFTSSDVSRITIAAYSEMLFLLDESEREGKIENFIRSSFDEIKSQNLDNEL